MPSMNFSTTTATVALMALAMLVVMGTVMFTIHQMHQMHQMRAKRQQRYATTGHGHGVHGVFPIFNRVVSMLLRLGIPVTILGPMMLLTVRGRTTGKPRTLPVDVHVYLGRRYLIATHGEGNWVHNLRAAGEGALSIGRRHEPFTATELPPESGGAIIRDVLSPLLASQGIRGAALRDNLGVSGDASLDDFISVAQSHPVFELVDWAR